MGSVAVHRIQQKLHLLHQGIFPLLRETGIPLEELTCNEKNGVVTTILESKQKKERNAVLDSQNGDKQASLTEDSANKITEGTVTACKHFSDIFSLIQTRTFCSVHLRPRKGLDR
jgi:hypothetical protein